MRIHFSSPPLEGQDVTLEASQMGKTTGPVTVRGWGKGGKSRTGSIAIVLSRMALPVAPEKIRLSVDFTASEIGIEGPASANADDPRFHDVIYLWEGLPAGTFENAGNLLAEMTDASRSHAPEPSVCFPAGPHTVTVTVTNRLTGASETGSVSFTVEAPADWFAPSAQAYVHPAGDPAKAPPGVTTYSTLQAAHDAIGMADGILWLERGQVYPDRWTIGTGGHRMVAAIGTGAAPRLNGITPAGTSSAGRANVDSGPGWGLETRKQLTFDGIDFQSDWNPVTETGTRFDETYQAYAHSIWIRSNVDCVIHDSTTHDVAGLVWMESGDALLQRHLHVENVVCNSFESYPIFTQLLPGSWFTARNVAIRQRPDARTNYTSGQQGAPIRINGSHVCLEGVELFANGGHVDSHAAQPAIKLQEFGANRPDQNFAGNRLYVGRCYFESPGGHVVSFGGAVQMNAVLERSILVAGYRTSSCVQAGSWGLSLRNCLMICPSSAYMAGGTGTIGGSALRRFVGFSHGTQHDGTADPAGSRNEIYMNHFVNLRSQVANGGAAVAVVEDVSGQGYPFVLQNNLEHQPGATTPVIPHAPLEDMPAFTPLCSLGYVYPDGSLEPGTATPPFGTHRPRSGSSALGGASQGLAARHDILGLPRGDPASLGAFETGL